jgi:hypothetical protein
MTQSAAHAHPDLLARPTKLPDDPAVVMLDAGTDPAVVAATYPTSSAAWATLAEAALADGRTIEGYAYARTGYHRGLDVLRRSGWKGTGPVPWSHPANRGFLRALRALGQASAAINETAEAERITAFIQDCDPSLA